MLSGEFEEKPCYRKGQEERNERIPREEREQED